MPEYGWSLPARAAGGGARRITFFSGAPGSAGRGDRGERTRDRAFRRSLESTSFNAKRFKRLGEPLGRRGRALEAALIPGSAPLFPLLFANPGPPWPRPRLQSSRLPGPSGRCKKLGFGAATGPRPCRSCPAPPRGTRTIPVGAKHLPFFARSCRLAEHHPRQDRARNARGPRIRPSHTSAHLLPQSVALRPYRRTSSPPPHRRPPSGPHSMRPWPGSDCLTALLDFSGIELAVSALRPTRSVAQAGLWARFGRRASSTGFLGGGTAARIHKRGQNRACVLTPTHRLAVAPPVAPGRGKHARSAAAGLVTPPTRASPRFTCRLSRGALPPGPCEPGGDPGGLAGGAAAPGRPRLGDLPSAGPIGPCSPARDDRYPLRCPPHESPRRPRPSGPRPISQRRSPTGAPRTWNAPVAAGPSSRAAPSWPRSGSDEDILYSANGNNPTQPALPAPAKVRALRGAEDALLPLERQWVPRP